MHMYNGNNNIMYQISHVFLRPQKSIYLQMSSYHYWHMRSKLASEATHSRSFLRFLIFKVKRKVHFIDTKFITIFFVHAEGTFFV